MSRSGFIKGLLLALFPIHSLAGIIRSKFNNPESIQHIRHATLLLSLRGQRILIDPMLSPRAAMDPVLNCGNEDRFPLVDMPLTAEAMAHMLHTLDAIVVTHLHRDHWDSVAQQILPKDIPVFCQPVDANFITQQGFKKVIPIASVHVWRGITLVRTKGQHGTGEMGKRMGDVSGFVFKTKEHVVYLAGDTVWCNEVKLALTIHKPHYTILNTGGARFLEGDAITMTPDQVIEVYKAAPQTKIIAVHMDTVNHCFVKRSHLKAALLEKHIDTVIIPDDGAMIALG